MTINMDYEELNAEALLARIRRKLRRLQPAMGLVWDSVRQGYVVTDTTAGRVYGPYGFEHLAALAHRVGALHKGERVQHLMVKSLAGVTYPQLPKLPRHLQFTVVTPMLKAALELLGEHGYVVHQLINGKLRPVDAIEKIDPQVSFAEPVTVEAKEFDASEDPEAAKSLIGAIEEVLAEDEEEPEDLP